MGWGGQCLILNSFPHTIQSRGLGLVIKKHGRKESFTLCMYVQGHNMAQHRIILGILVFISGKCFFHGFILNCDFITTNWMPHILCHKTKHENIKIKLNMYYALF